MMKWFHNPKYAVFFFSSPISKFYLLFTEISFFSCIEGEEEIEFCQVVKKCSPGVQ